MARKKLRITRKAHKRKSYVKDVIPGKGVKRKRIPKTIVKKSTFLTKDRGKLGLTPKAQRWFKPVGTLSGWEKTQSTSERRRKAARGRTDLSSARALNQLANVTSDRATERVARADAKYFFEKHRRGKK